jgi:hypothetical protein
VGESPCEFASSRPELVVVISKDDESWSRLDAILSETVPVSVEDIVVAVELKIPVEKVVVREELL